MPVNDLYGLAIADREKLRGFASLHFTPAGPQLIAARILESLSQQPSPEKHEAHVTERAPVRSPLFRSWEVRVAAFPPLHDRYGWYNATDWRNARHFGRVFDMAAQLQYPGEYSVEGVFALDANDLRELDGLLNDAKRAFDKRAREELNRQVNKRLRDQEVKEEDKDKARAEIRNGLKRWHPYTTDERSVSVDCRSKNKIAGTSFAEIIDRHGLEHEHPTEAEVLIRRADYQLRIEIFSRFSSLRFSREDIHVTVSPNDDLAIGIARGIRDWAEARRQVPWWPKFNFLFGVAGYWCLALSFLWLPYGVFTGVTVKSPVQERATQLTTDGVNSENQAEAIGLLLRLHTENVAAKTQYTLEVKLWYVVLLSSGIILVTAAVCRPKSTLGLGRSVRRMKFDRWVIRHVKVTLWIWLGAITCSIIGSAVYDWVLRTSGNHP